MNSQHVADKIETWFATGSVKGTSRKGKEMESASARNWKSGDWSMVLTGTTTNASDNPPGTVLAEGCDIHEGKIPAKQRVSNLDRLPPMETEEQLWFALGIARGWLNFASICSVHHDVDEECPRCAIGQWTLNSFEGRWAMRLEDVPAL